MRFLLLAAAFDAALDLAVEAGSTLDAAVVQQSELVDQRTVDPRVYEEAAHRNEAKAAKYRKLGKKLQEKVLAEHHKTEEAFESLKHASDPVARSLSAEAPADLAARVHKALRAEQQAERQLDTAEQHVRQAAARALRGARSAGIAIGRDQEIENATVAMQSLEQALAAQNAGVQHEGDARAQRAEQVAASEETHIQQDQQEVVQLEQRGALDVQALHNATAQVAALSATSWQHEQQGLEAAERTVAAVEQNLTDAARDADAVKASNAEIQALSQQVAQRQQQRVQIQQQWHQEHTEQMEVQQAQGQLKVTESQLEASRQAEQEMVQKLEQIRDASNEVSQSLSKQQPAPAPAAVNRQAEAQQMAAMLAARAQANNEARVEAPPSPQWAPLAGAASSGSALAAPAGDMPALDLD